MAINLQPTGVYGAGYEYQADGTNVSNSNPGIYIPLSAIPSSELTAAEADPASGDYRKVLWGLLEANFQHFDNLDSESTPEEITISRTGLSFVDESTVRRSYTVTFNFTVDGYEVADESS